MWRRLSDAAMHRVMTSGRAVERSWIEDRARFRRTVRTDLARAVLTIVALIAVMFIPLVNQGGGGWWSVVRTVAALVLGFHVGTYGLPGIRRAIAYRNGWLAGRAELMDAAAEASRRGMSDYEWVEAQLAKDLHAMGLPDAAVREATWKRDGYDDN